MKTSIAYQAPSHEDVLGSGSIATSISKLGTRLRSVITFTAQSLYLRGKSPHYPLSRRLSGPQSRSGRGEKRKKIPPPAENRIPVDQPVA
jgi:hypothetical protein